MKTPENRGRHTHTPKRRAILFALISLASQSVAGVQLTDASLFRDSTDIRISRFSGRFAMFAQISGHPVLGASANVFIIPHLSLNAGIGLVGHHFGANIYLLRRAAITKLCPYVGFQRVYVREVSFLSDSHRHQWGWFLPLGLEFIARKGVSMQFELGSDFFATDYGQWNTSGFMATFRIGGYMNEKRK